MVYCDTYCNIYHFQLFVRLAFIAIPQSPNVCWYWKT